MPRLEVVWGDAKDRNRQWEAWLERARTRFRIAVVAWPAVSAGFGGLPKRWVSERPLAWRGRDRRHSKDYQWRPESSVAWVPVSAIGQMRRRLAPEESHRQAPFKDDRPDAA